MNGFSLLSVPLFQFKYCCKVNFFTRSNKRKENWDPRLNHTTCKLCSVLNDLSYRRTYGRREAMLQKKVTFHKRGVLPQS